MQLLKRAGPKTKRGSAPLLARQSLNRALLARQMLLERHPIPVTDAVEFLLGLQAQSPQAPYVGLWSRLKGFKAEELSNLIEARKLVRVVVMRGTLHLVSARDCLTLRPLVQPVLDRAFLSSTFNRDLEGVDKEALIEAGREALEEKAMTLADLRKILAPHWPKYDATSLAYAVHVNQPLRQIPPRRLWKKRGAPRATTAEAWLGKPLAGNPSAEKIVLRYLAAFGPASVMDAQSWSGLTRLGPVFEKLRPKLRTFTDDTGRELFDLPEAPRPDPETPAPVRFLPEYDNLTLAYANRARVIRLGPSRPVPENVTLKGFLVDGFVAGFWKILEDKKRATLEIEPFAKLTKKDTKALQKEGEKLLAFAAPDVGAHDFRVVPPGS